MQLILSNTSDQFDLQASIAGSLHYSICFTDIDSTSVTTPSSAEGIITTTAQTGIISGTGLAGGVRKIQYLNIYNNGVTNTITISKDVGGTSYFLHKVTLQNGETFRIVNDEAKVFSVGGVEKQVTSENLIDADSKNIYKVGTAPEAAGQFYCHSKDSGFPGAWAVGTPGINGRNTDGTLAADAGCINIGNPASGQWYLRDFDIGSSVACQLELIDVLWVNTGLVVTTTTAQAITQPTLPARDDTGSTNGADIRAGILVTTATTNAGAITNTTLSYTNSGGVAGRTATISSFPATAVIGTFVKFQLQAGDKGIRSIQSITLGTSYATGTISLCCFNGLMSKSVYLANTGSQNLAKIYDIPLYNGHCLLPIMWATGTGAATINGNIYFVNK